jgi:hypothetical protein
MKRTEYSVLRQSDFGAKFDSEGYWAWSLDEDGDGDGVWTNYEPTKEAAIAEAIASRTEEDRFTDCVYVAPIKEYEVCLSVSDMLDNLNEAAYDECGEVASDGISPTREQMYELQAEINRVFGEWLTRHKLWPKWSMIGKIERIPVNQEEQTHE